MWTPKRIVLLVLGFFVFFSGYMLYASALGGIDGLPPLPAVDLPPDHPGNVIGPPPSHGLKLEDKLRQAFGQDCPELKWALKLELNSKNMVVAARDFTIEDDGRLALEQISVALFGKDAGDGRGVEINTVRAKQAFLTFDKKLGRNDKEFGGRRIVAAELIDDVKIVNNHRTPQRDDDLHVDIDKGPLYYDESKRLIWTEDWVHLQDDQAQPPTDIRGQGLEVHLTAAEPPRPEAKPVPRNKTHNETISGVERIVLKSSVSMHLSVAGGFPGAGSGPDAKAAPPAAAKPADKPEKSNLVIYTPGRFEYEFRKDGDVARFDAPDGDPQRPEKVIPPVSVDHVTSTAGGGELHDLLQCLHLELHMRPKDAPAAKDDRSPEHGLQVESAHAVCLNPSGVYLSSDSQNLDAHGCDFQYDGKTHLTVLKGDPAKPDSGMSANQDGNKIRAHELQILDLPPGPDGKPRHQVTALGPGQIDLFDKKTKTWPVHASWQDKLVSTKDGSQDLIVLSGTATFTDDEHGQSLQADTLKVWLAASEDAKTAAAPANAPTARRPSHIEAVGNVSVASSDLNIPHTGLLVVWFRDVPVEAIPSTAPAAKPGAQAAAGPAVHEAAKPAAPDTAKADEPPAPARPIDLTARSVYAWVARSDQKSNLEKLQAEGDVHVHQDPAKADDKGVDVKGDSLEMTYHPEGNFLVVMGDLAELLMDDLYIIGPEVNIDQAANKAWVNGIGAMQMKSKTDFQGQPLANPVPLTVHWNKEMFFNGRYAVFTQGVQAEQEEAHLACQEMQVIFDHSISLKEGNKGGPPPQVKNLVCDREVRVDARALEGDRVVRQQRMRAPSLTMTPLEPDDVGAKPATTSDGSEIRASGPGDIRLFQHGGQDPLAAPAGPGAPVTAAKPGPNDGKAEDPTKLTYISYGGDVGGGSMYINTKTNTATFLQNVRVLNMPCDDPNIEIDLDVLLNRLPEGALYMKSDRLDVFDHGDKKKSQQEMYAKGHVLVQAKDFWGRADKMTYNEAKDQIIFEGGYGGLATLYKIKQRGAEAQKIEGKTIVYIRSTGMFKIEGGEWISGN